MSKTRLRRPNKNLLIIFLKVILRNLIHKTNVSTLKKTLRFAKRSLDAKTIIRFLELRKIVQRMISKKLLRNGLLKYTQTKTQLLRQQMHLKK